MLNRRGQRNLKKHQWLVSRNDFYIGDVKHGIRHEREIVVHIKKKITLNRRHRWNHVGIEGEWAQLVSELVNLLVVGRSVYRRQSTFRGHVRRPSGINNQACDLSRSE